MVGDVPVGAHAPISVQSMTVTRTADVDGTRQQVDALARPYVAQYLSVPAYAGQQRRFGRADPGRRTEFVRRGRLEVVRGR